ncbi:LacI family DNA-binding transcriptional regulator [Nocardioides sp. S-58]|uniref:LacI family DNA-binding transcriptional regulator n=1 Tax=Nocardioides renjunii TaxID=3095075 RepID=A0ABU5KEL9_9ACTN|nr:LacI family DNA-binding transcriptional regulator [Nocardioides sp. S-58]MDZ5663406.1 LacI family DNA-binding transcriptional regulator [Nocardioides sp. S-58]
MAVRLKDVALLAGVSVKTVSNVINGYPHVSATTRAKVEAAVEQLDYRPNLQARSLRTGRTGVIALGVPRLDEVYFAEVAAHVIEAADRLGLTVLVEQTDGERQRELEVLSGIRPGLVDGVILSPLGLLREDIEQTARRTPVVMLGEHVTDSTVDHLRIDNVKAAARLTHTLLAAGRRRIAVVGTPTERHVSAARLRLAGYERAHEELGIPWHEELWAPAANYRRADGAAAIHRLVEAGAPFDAVFCFNDLLALGALAALRQHGVRVPEDVAVGGFDDIDECAYSVPTLTTVSPDKVQLAVRAVHTLHARLSGVEESPDPDVPFVVVERDSTAGDR